MIIECYRFDEERLVLSGNVELFLDFSSRINPLIFAAFLEVVINGDFLPRFNDQMLKSVDKHYVRIDFYICCR